MTQFIMKAVAPITIGLDLGKRFSHALVVRSDGKILVDQRITTCRAEFVEFFGQWEGADVVFEVGPQALWTNALLLELGHNALAVNPRELPQIYKTKKKTDRIDARKLVKARFSQELPLVELRDLDKHADLAVIRTRIVFVEQRTKLVNHARSVCSSFGLNLPKCDAAYFHRHVRDKIPEELKDSLIPVIDELESLNATIKRLDKKIDKLSEQKYPETRPLKTVPGIASLTALAFVLTLHNSKRFGSSRLVGSYLGLVPKLDQSCTSNPQLRITKSGDPYLRKLLVTAAHHVLGARGSDSALRRYGHRICAEGSNNRGAKKRAVVAVARKLGVLLHHVWQTGEHYTPFPNGVPRTQGKMRA